MHSPLSANVRTNVNEAKRLGCSSFGLQNAAVEGHRRALDIVVRVCCLPAARGSAGKELAAVNIPSTHTQPRIHSRFENVRRS
jgi:hypothetical protein